MSPRADARAIKAQVVGSLASRVNLEVLTAGREVVQQSSRRWRRVTDGNPCGFCAMLASRGPVYTSEASASRIGGRGKAIDPTAPRKRGGQAKGIRARGKGRLGDRFHSLCGCTVEPFDGDPSEWEPTPDEQRFIDAYEATHELGLSELEQANRIERWLAENPVPGKAAAEVVELSIDGLDDDAIDALMDRLAGAGDWVGAERVQELADARRAALKPKPWKPDPADAFNPQTYEWFEELPEDDQFDFLDRLRDARSFQENQWSYVNAKTAPKRGSIPTERQIRAEWDAYLESEWVRLEEATRGVTLTREAIAEGRRTRDLMRVNPKTARKWASEEVRRYWDENGRMTFESFRAGYTGGLEALGAQRAGFWA